MTTTTIGDPWEKTLALLRPNINTTSFETWFRPLKVVSLENNRIVLELHDHTGVEVLKIRYMSMLSSAIKQAFGQTFDIVISDGRSPVPEANAQRSAHDGGQLNPKYTFDTFVVGESNRFAHAASLAVAELPSEAYNPLFLYGGVGLGKTHLMHAIGHHILGDNPACKLMYLTSERFTNDVITAIQTKTTKEMRDYLRNADVLMIDDIQFIAGKTSTQEEFFHTFNHLHNSGKQIIISSDRPPKDIPTLEERLRSRFEWGLIADIQKPDYETRVAILRKKVTTEHIEVSDEVLNFIAEKMQSNIRELEGLLTRVNAQSMLENQPITMDLAKSALASLVGNRAIKRITPELIMQAVAEYFHVERMDLLSQRRNQEIAKPRQIAMYLTREMTNLSTTRIGDAFGGRDHTTVMHGCEKIARLAREDRSIASTLEDIKQWIQDK